MRVARIRRKHVLLGVTAAVAIAVPTALADNGQMSDPTGDSTPSSGGEGPAFTDITKIKHGHTRGGKLRHVVFVRDANSATKALTQLQIRARGKDYLIDRTGVLGLRPGSGKAPKVTTKRKGNKIIFVFDPKVIGSPSKYKWAATIGSGDTSPLDFDRAPDGSGYLKHSLGRAGKASRYRGFHAGADGAPIRVATQGELHQFVFIDRERKRTKYRLVLRGPGETKKKRSGRTNRKGRDSIEDSLFVNDVGGPGRWKASWRVGGEKVAKYRFRLIVEPEG